MSRPAKIRGRRHSSTLVVATVILPAYTGLAFTPALRGPPRLHNEAPARSGQISAFVDGQLKPDEATSVDCSQVQDFGITFVHGFEGFLVIESTLSLDVVAVYTAGRGAARSRASTSSTSPNADSGDLGLG